LKAVEATVRIILKNNLLNTKKVVRIKNKIYKDNNNIKINITVYTNAEKMFCLLYACAAVLSSVALNAQTF